MTENEAQNIARCVVQELENSRAISNELHGAHHRWVEHKIKKEKQREEMWNRVKAQAFGGLIIAMVIGAGSALAWIGRLILKSKGS